MPLVPTHRLVLLFVLPFALGVGAVFHPAFVGPLWGANGLLVALGLLDAWLGRARLVSVTREGPRIASVGRPNPVRITLVSRAARPLSVALTDDRADELQIADLPQTATVPAGGRVSLTYHVQPSKRGRYELGDHHLRHLTPLGLWRRQLRVTARTPVRVYPDVQTVRTFELLARRNRENMMVRAVRLRGGENEFERLRDYSRDDEYRSIDWKATARRQKLICREYQQERNQTLMALVDCGRLMTGESRGLSQLDHALSSLLMLAHVAARSGDQVGLLAFDSEVRTFLPPAAGRTAAARIIEASYDLHANLVEPDFDRAFGVLQARVRKRALVVLFSQVIDEHGAAALLRHVRALGPRHLPLCVLFRDPDLDRLADPERLDAHDPAGDLFVRGTAAEAILWRERLARELGARGASVLHVPPHRATPALINRYLEIKAHHLL